MKFKRWHIVVGICTLVVASAASALTLGRNRGAVLLGRAFDVTVVASMDAQEATPELSCFSAELFYGDSRVSPSQISISAERASPVEMRIRVRSATAIDEPVATLYLRSTCGGNSSRRYVLLADVPSEGETPSSAPPRVANPSNTPQSISPGTALGGAPYASQQAQLLAQERAQAAREKRRAEREARLERQQAARAANGTTTQAAAKTESIVKIRPATKQQDSKAARLKIDLLDMDALAAAGPGLRSSRELLSTPTTDENLRAQAFALWSTLNAPPEDVMRNSQRVQTLELQLKQAQELGKRQSQDIARLDAELLAAKRARYVNPFTIALGLLALVAAALAAWLWLRRGQGVGQPWWRGTAKTEKEEQKLWEHIAASPAELAKPVPASVKIPATSKPPVRPLGATATGTAAGLKAAPGVQAGKDSLDFDISGQAGLGLSRKTSATPVVRNDVAASERNASFAPSGFGNTNFNSRTSDAEELFDIQEQADFFLSLGQPEQAIEVLTNHISDNVETSALAYMDLFDIYHRLGRRNEYEQLREEFNRVFNAQVPEFDRHTSSSRGLEGYPEALKSIQELWPSSAVLDLIEESIFRKPDSSNKPFDIQAYRELMALYSLAKEIADPNFAPPGKAITALSTVTATELAALEPLPSRLSSAQVPLDDDGLSFSLRDDPDQTMSLSPEQSAKLAQAAKDAQESKAGSTKDQAKDHDDNSLDFDLSDFGDRMSEKEAEAELDRQLREQLERQIKDSS
jgi:pilus assembly protein FimV